MNTLLPAAALAAATHAVKIEAAVGADWREHLDYFNAEGLLSVAQNDL
jgi:hypothetical protein